MFYHYAYYVQSLRLRQAFGKIHCVGQKIGKQAGSGWQCRQWCSKTRFPHRMTGRISGFRTLAASHCQPLALKPNITPFISLFVLRIVKLTIDGAPSSFRRCCQEWLRQPATRLLTNLQVGFVGLKWSALDKSKVKQAAPRIVLLTLQQLQRYVLANHCLGPAVSLSSFMLSHR